MFIFNKMEKVDNRAEVMLKKMKLERSWRMWMAADLERQADGIKRPENYSLKLSLLDTACKYRREAIEIGEEYDKLKEVLNRLH